MTVIFGPDGNFEGHAYRECGEHRTVGSHRAWCFDCGEWCSPLAPCARCELPRLRRVESCARSLLAEHRDDPAGTGEETLFDVLAETLAIAPFRPDEMVAAKVADLLVARGWTRTGSGPDGTLWQSADGNAVVAIPDALRTSSYEWPGIVDRIGTR